MKDELRRAEHALSFVRNRDDVIFALRKLAEAWWELANDLEKNRVGREGASQRLLRLKTLGDGEAVKAIHQWITEGKR